MFYSLSSAAFSGACCLLWATAVTGQTLPADSIRLNEPLRRTDLPTGPIPVAPPNKATLCNRAAIIADYTTNFLGSAVTTTELGWTGSVAGCVSGSISALAQSRTLQRINYYRRLAGVTDNTTFDPSRNTATQDAALMMKANNALSHTPPNTWLCYTAAGYSGADNSNIASGSHSAQSVKQFMDDAGSGNTAVGHRRWLLYTRQGSFGHGSTDITDIIWVFNPFVSPPSVPPFVAFPPAGYVPRDLIPARWSLSIPNADFTGCTVTVNNEAGATLPQTQQPLANGYGDNTVVWDFMNPGTDLAWTSTTDKAFDVRVAGVKIGTVTQPDYVYRVVAIDPTTPGLTLTSVNPTCGPALNNGSITANFDRGANSYGWNTGATTQTVSNLGPGSYTVTVTDKNNCPYSQAAILTNTTANIPVITSSSTAVCAGDVVSLTASNCTGTLTWSDGLGTGTTKSAMPAITTAYSVTCAETACISSTAAVTVAVSGPQPALCTVVAPNGLGNYFGVERFVFNTIDAASSSSFNDGANYINRACVFSTTVTAGSSYTALVKGNYTNSHRCRVYIDFNNDGMFDSLTETVLTGTGNSVTATVPIPTTAVQSVPLRVRVVADPSASVSPCLLPGSGGYGSGQAEDYALTILSNTPPAPVTLTVPVLTASATSVCGGSVVSLTATNCNGTLTWSGGLAGSGTSQSVMPLLTTTYSVSCEQAGAVSTTASVSVMVRPGPILAVCSVSATNGLSSSYGVERFVFNTIDARSSTSSDDGSNYINLACDISTTVTAGLSYSALVKGVGIIGYQARIYIDYNNNGVLTDPGETALIGAGNTVTATVPIPVTATTNTLLRVRVVADALLSSGVGPCLLPGASGQGSGQAEDYSLLILPAPPCLSMVTVKAGSWTDATVWSCNRIPTVTDDILINHALTLPVGTQGNARRMTVGSAGRLIYGTNARTTLNP